MQSCSENQHIKLHIPCAQIKGKPGECLSFRITAALGILQKRLKAAVGTFHAMKKKPMHSKFSLISMEFPGILNGIVFLLSSLDFQCSSPQLVAATLHIFQNCNINIAEHDSIETCLKMCKGCIPFACDTA